MSNSLVARELLSERRANFCSQKTFHNHQQQHTENSRSPSPLQQLALGCLTPASPMPVPLGNSNNGGGGSGGGGLQLAAAAQNKRKEKARIAARARRSQEASIIMEMASELQITQEKLRRIDKATIVKLAIDYMRAFEVLCGRQRPAPTQTPAKLALPYALAAPRSAAHKPTTETRSNTTQYIREQQEEDGENTQSALHDQEYDTDSNDEHEDNEQENHYKHYQQEQRQQQQDNKRQLEPPEKKPPVPLFSAPKLATASIFAPKTQDNMNSHFLMIEEKDNGKSTFVLKPDTEVLDDDDLTHLAPQAGDISISLEADPLDGIPSDDLLMLSPKSSHQAISVFFTNCTKAA